MIYIIYRGKWGTKNYRKFCVLSASWVLCSHFCEALMANTVVNCVYRPDAELYLRQKNKWFMWLFFSVLIFFCYKCVMQMCSVFLWKKKKKSTFDKKVLLIVYQHIKKKNYYDKFSLVLWLMVYLRGSTEKLIVP